MKTKELLFRLILVLLSSLMALVLAEVIYRVSLVDQHEYSVSQTGDQYQFYQFDPKLGWANTPGASGTFSRSEYAYRISVNTHGMRQHEVSKKNITSSFRVVVMGDSFVWGIGINDEARFTEVLEGMLPNVEVLNFGTSGYSPVQYLLMLDDIAEFQPDLVVILFCLGNDFTDNVLYQRYGYFKPYAALDENGDLEIKGYPLPNVKDFGFDKNNRLFGSALLGELRNKYLVSNLRQEGLDGFSNKLLHTRKENLSPEDRRLKSEAIRINEALLGEIQSTLSGKGIPLIIASAPTKREYNKRRKYGHQGYFPSVERKIQRSSSKLGIAFIPNVENLSGEDFWIRDGHWNPTGHVKIATSIANYITENGYLAAKID
jgi:lysophospholipase L1-like esterase